MSRIKLLRTPEIKEFDSPSSFDFTLQTYYFSVDNNLDSELKKLRHPCSKIGILLQWGYFKYHGRFFEVTKFKKEDITFVAKQLGLTQEIFDFFVYYNNHLAYEHRAKILSIIHWRSFDKYAFKHQIDRLVALQMLPRKILWETKAYLFRQKMEAPAYNKYLRTINESMLSMSKHTNELLEKCLSDRHRKILDEFLFKSTPYQAADIVKYKTINQSDKPRKIKKSLDLFEILKNRLDKLKKPINEMQLSDAVIDYHANWVHIADNDKLAEHSDKYLFLLCFLIRQVKLRHDFFVDLILQCVKAYENRIERLHQENYFQDQKQRTKATKILIESRISYKQQIQKIKNILKIIPDAHDKIAEIEQVIQDEKKFSQEQEKLLDTIEAEMDRDEKSEYYHLLETKSIWLNNRIGHVINHLMINAENTDASLLKAINYYIHKKGNINAPTDLNWLDERQKNFIWRVDKETGEMIFQRKIYKISLLSDKN